LTWSNNLTNSVDNTLARKAATLLADTLASELHLPGERERHRAQLAEVIALAHDAINEAQRGGHARGIARARLTLLKAQMARAEDARHGAGQLSLGSQRAPTREDCEDGWQRVEEIVVVAEQAAEHATQLANQLDTKAAEKAAQRANVAALNARRIIEQRNHAYTFHTAPGFSFGEGWYLAAAATLDEHVLIQIEPDQPQTAQAERFVEDAGLGERLVAYRCRPRANKHLPAIIAHAFRKAPLEAQKRLRSAFLGDEPIPHTIAKWADQRLTSVAAENQKKVLLWVRSSAYHAHRNTTYAELVQLVEAARAARLMPILIGDAVAGSPPSGCIDMTLFWKRPLFRGVDMRRAQLQLFEHLADAHELAGQIGVTSAGMDGPALMGLETMYLTDEPNVRLGKWVGAVPGYREIVRDGQYRERIEKTLATWAM
jgi:hypothetical protein